VTMPHSAVRYASGCRCLFCADAYAAASAELQAAAAKRAMRHGTYRCYRNGCRCTYCRAAANEASKRWAGAS